MLTRKKWEFFFTRLCMLYDKPYTPEQSDMYYEGLKERLCDEILDPIYKLAFRSAKSDSYLPRPGDIEAFADEVSQEGLRGYVVSVDCPCCSSDGYVWVTRVWTTHPENGAMVERKKTIPAHSEADMILFRHLEKPVSWEVDVAQCLCSCPKGTKVIDSIKAYNLHPPKGEHERKVPKHHKEITGVDPAPGSDMNCRRLMEDLEDLLSEAWGPCRNQILRAGGVVGDPPKKSVGPKGGVKVKIVSRGISDAQKGNSTSKLEDSNA
jgi:hypothetical protein